MSNQYNNIFPYKEFTVAKATSWLFKQTSHDITQHGSLNGFVQSLIICGCYYVYLEDAQSGSLDF